jgi:hypothetical protein
MPTREMLAVRGSFSTRRPLLTADAAPVLVGSGAFTYACGRCRTPLRADMASGEVAAVLVVRCPAWGRLTEA